MNNLSNLLTWKQRLGYLPIRLNPKNKDSDYLMLNTDKDSFCLQLSGEKKSDEHYFSTAWSCNTKIFLVINENDFLIYNWDKNFSIDTISHNEILSDLDFFYSNVLQNNSESSNEIVSFFSGIFSQIRNITQEKTNPVIALRLFYSLLINLEEKDEKIDLEKWNIDKVDYSQEFDVILKNFKSVDSRIKPNLELILRHSSSKLFQETDKEVSFLNVQKDLFGGISTEIKSNENSSIHHTPSFLNTSIVENVLSNLDLSLKSIKVFDPCCYSSENILEFLKQLKELNYKGTVQIVGWDTSEAAVNTSKFLIASEKRTQWKNKLEFEFKLVDNALSQSWRIKYDVILMNPPYVSWDLLNSVDRDLLSQSLGFNFKGQPNIASAYIYKAIVNLNENGVIGSVIPSSLLTLDSYKNLRDDIYYNVAIKIIAKLGNFVFDNTHSDVSMLVGKKEKTFEIPTFIWTKNKKGIPQKAIQALRKMQYSNLASFDQKEFSIYTPNKFPLINNSWKPISLNDNDFIKNLESGIENNSLVKIESLFNVKQGIRQGAKNIFKLTASNYRRLPENEKVFFRPVIDNDAIKNGVISKKHFIWYPYNKYGEIFKTEEQLVQKASYYYSVILKSHKSILEKRGGIMEWWGLSRPRHWQFEKQPRLYSTEFGKADSFAFDGEGNFVAERGNAWIPLVTFSESDFYFYLAVFSSDFFNKLLSIYSKQLLSGWDLGKKYTSNIPIPNIENELVKKSDGYLRLVQIGKALSKGNNNPKLKSILESIFSDSFYPKN